jgi:putative transposase
VQVIALGGIEDHVHLLVRIPTTLSVAQLVKQVKGATSHLVTHGMGGCGTFKWQGGYGAFTVSKRNVPLVREYVLQQERHHSESTVARGCEPPFGEG